MMDSLAEGAARLGIALKPRQLEQFEAYYRELTDWNKRVNLTTITGYEEVQVKHFLDSLTVAAYLPDDKPCRVMDVGTGAGFPGLPLRIAFPKIRLTLLEATAKKTRFLQHLVNELKLDKINIVAERAETAAHSPQHREQFDMVLARAVAPLPALVELTLPFARTGGCIIAMKKGDIADEVRAASKAVETLGGSLREVKPVRLPELNDGRCLVIIEKIKPAPAPYPRRPGMPEKRPLG